MNFSFLLSLFKKDKKTSNLPDSLLVKKLKDISSTHAFTLFNEVTIFHHSSSYKIPLLLLDETRGLYIFEKKTWSFDDLQDFTVQKAPNQDSSDNMLSFQKTQNLINKKINELTHHDGVPIFNYLIMDNLSTDEYGRLNDSFIELIPARRVIFSDSTTEEILEKLSFAELSDVKLPSKEDIFGNLLVQYSLLDENESLKLCSREQIDFINSETFGLETLNGASRSGKTNATLLKAIFQTLKNKDKKILIIKPTPLSRDILKKKLLDMVERAIVEINLSQIIILTPIELINLHLKKLKKEPLLKEALRIDEILMTKKIHIADLVMCDDASLLREDFIQYLTRLQSDSSLLLVNNDSKEATYEFSGAYASKERVVNFHKANQHAKALLIVSKLLATAQPKDILIVSASLTREELLYDLEHFIEGKASLLDSSKNLLQQNLESLSLATYADVNELSAKHVILLDACSTALTQVQSAIGLATISVDAIYEEECESIHQLKEKYESN